MKSVTDRITQTWQHRTDCYSEKGSHGQRAEKVEVHPIGWASGQD